MDSSLVDDESELTTAVKFPSRDKPRTLTMDTTQDATSGMMVAFQTRDLARAEKLAWGVSRGERTIDLLHQDSCAKTVLFYMDQFCIANNIDPSVACPWVHISKRAPQPEGEETDTKV